MLLELCELGDQGTLTVLRATELAFEPVDPKRNANASSTPAIGLLLFLLRQALSFDDKKACCAVGSLLMWCVVLMKYHNYLY